MEKSRQRGKHMHMKRYYFGTELKVCYALTETEEDKTLS